VPRAESIERAYHRAGASGLWFRCARISIAHAADA